MSVWARFARGLAGIASSLLDHLQRRAGRQRDEWAAKNQSLAGEVDRLNRTIEQEFAFAYGNLDYARARVLHSEAVALANTAHDAFATAQAVLDALGETIVQTAIQRRQLEQRKRSSRSQLDRASLQREIDDMHRLRDEYLIPDKDRVKAEKNRLLEQVRVLNRRAGQLREVRSQRLQIEAPLIEGRVKFFDAQRGFGFIATQLGDAYLHRKLVIPGRALTPGTQVKCRVIRDGGRLRVVELS